MIKILAFLIAFTGCTSPIVVTGPGPARARIEAFTHVMQRSPSDVPTVEVTRLLTVTNPTNEAVEVVCTDFRIPVRAHREERFALYTGDDACDLQPSSTYSPNTNTGNLIVPAFTPRADVLVGFCRDGSAWPVGTPPDDACVGLPRAPWRRDAR